MMIMLPTYTETIAPLAGGLLVHDGDYPLMDAEKNRLYPKMQTLIVQCRNFGEAFDFIGSLIRSHKISIKYVCKKKTYSSEFFITI